MKHKYTLYISCCVLLFLYLQAPSQNLVPDSSFEHNKFIPMEFSSLHASNSWNAPSLGTTDLFCKCDRKNKFLTDKAYSYVDVPLNPMGYQYPRSGRCYAGLFALSHGYYREYLQTPLLQPLEKGKTYRFTMYLSLADYSKLSIDLLGVCFLRNKARYASSNAITTLEPVYMDIEKEIGQDVQQWHKVSVTYKALGGESYILIGSFEIGKVSKTKFKAPKEIRSRINQSVERDAYYYIDDVSLVETAAKEESTDSVPDSPGISDPAVKADSSFVSKHVLFQTNETILLPSSYPELNAMAGYLKNHPQLEIRILGHTDNSGNELKNRTLSEGRAKAVAEYLVAAGVDPEDIYYEGHGSSKPVSTNDTEEGRQLNRRVEFVISKK